MSSPLVSSSPLISSSRVSSTPMSSDQKAWWWVLIPLGIGVVVLIVILLVCGFATNNTKLVRPLAPALTQRNNNNNNCGVGNFKQQKPKQKESSKLLLKKLTQKQFEAKIDHPKGEEAVVMAFGAWCGWSQKSMPTFAAAAAESEVPFYLLEDKDAKNIIVKYNIRGFPTFLKFKNGVKKDYRGDRSKESLLLFASS